MESHRFTNGITRAEELRLIAGTTFSIQNTADAVETFTEAQRLSTDEHEPVAALIDVKVNNCLFAFGVDPVPSGLGHARDAGDKFALQSTDEIKAFRFINAVGTEQCTLNVTFYYRP